MDLFLDKIDSITTLVQSNSRSLSLFLLIGKRVRGVKTHTFRSTQRVGVGSEATNLTPRDQIQPSDWSTESYLTPPQT